MSQENEQTPEEGKAIIVAALFSVLPQAQQAEILRKHPREMGKVAGTLSRVLPPDLLKELAVTEKPTVPLPPEAIIKTTGRGRFNAFSKIVSKIPLLRKLL